jgi:Phytanoyl-CoA dioxygenase (PhyH)
VPFDVSQPTRALGSGRATRWWLAPLWLAAVFTGAKSFVDNPILGSKRLNGAGLHPWRLKAAHRLAAWRRSRLAHLAPADVRAQFDRNGFVVLPDFLPSGQFAALKSAVLDLEKECRSQQQGDTITMRTPVGPDLLRRVPALRSLLRSSRWKGIMAYVASNRSQPLYYLQAIAGGTVEGPPDPQLELHSDAFQPSLKAWLFLTDVAEDGRPLTYVAGSHRLTPERLAWEQRKSVEIDGADRLSQRGSLRVRLDELTSLGLPQPTAVAVPANTLVVADTCGFHARAASDRPTLRIELWAYCRRSPFLPWTGFDLLSWGPIASRRAQSLTQILDWLGARGWAKQHWQPAGRWRDVVSGYASDTGFIFGTKKAHQRAPATATPAVTTNALP